jgi:hypothetical protein
MKKSFTQNQRRSLFCRLCITVGMYLVTATVLAAQDAERLPSLDYYTSLKLLRPNFMIRERIGVTREEAAALRKIEDDTWKWIMTSRDTEAARREFRLNGTYTLAPAENEAIGEKIREVLPPDKFERIIPSIMSDRFSVPWDVFSDEEVIAFCDIDEKELRRVLKITPRTKEKYEQERRESLRQQTRVLLDQLPVKSREKFVALAGNRYFPDVINDTDIDPSKIPFPETTSPYAVATMRPILVQELGAIFTPEEEREMAEICAQFESSRAQLYATDRERVGYESKDLELGREMTRKLSELIGKKRLLLCYQELAMLGVQESPEKFFEDSFHCYYLQLTLDERQSLRKAALEAERKNQTAISKLNWKIFDELTEQLDAESKRKVQAVFLGHWENYITLKL